MGQVNDGRNEQTKKKLLFKENLLIEPLYFVPQKDCCFCTTKRLVESLLCLLFVTAQKKVNTNCVVLANNYYWVTFFDYLKNKLHFFKTVLHSQQD